MGQNHIEIFAAFGDDSSKPDDLRTGADDDAEFDFAVILPVNVTVIEFRSFGFHRSF